MVRVHPAGLLRAVTCCPVIPSHPRGDQPGEFSPGELTSPHPGTSLLANLLVPETLLHLTVVPRLLADLERAGPSPAQVCHLAVPLASLCRVLPPHHPGHLSPLHGPATVDSRLCLHIALSPAWAASWPEFRELDSMTGSSRWHPCRGHPPEAGWGGGEEGTQGGCAGHNSTWGMEMEWGACGGCG